MPKSNTGFSPNDPNWFQLARGPYLQEDRTYSWVEAAYVWPKSVNGVNYYYLFVNWGGCCSGVNSTYKIMMGRSTSPMGPFVDKTGKDLMNGGGSILLKKTNYMIGPGHMGHYERGNNQEIMTFHYYDSRRNDGPLSWITEREVTFKNGWPIAGDLLSSHGDSPSPPTAPPPVTSPTPSPSCSDTCSFRFDLDSFPIQRRCSWITKNKKTSSTRKAKYCSRSTIKSNCPATCDSNCANDQTFAFTLRKTGTTVKCNWMTKNRKKAEIRKGNYCGNVFIASSCPSACGRCPYF